VQVGVCTSKVSRRKSGRKAILHSKYVAWNQRVGWDAHLFRYLDEQSFRFNEREGEDKDRLAKTLGGVVGRRLTYDELTGKTASG
jgi:hypothetical protein